MSQVLKLYRDKFEDTNLVNSKYNFTIIKLKCQNKYKNKAISASRRINILHVCIKFKIRTPHFLQCHLPSYEYLRIGFILTCGKHLLDSIISLKGGVWAQKKTKFNLTIFYWNASERPGKWAVMYMCVRGMNFAFVFMIYRFDFGNLQTV